MFTGEQVAVNTPASWAEDWVVRDNLLTLVRAWLAAAKEVQSSVDEVRLSSGVR